MLPLMKDQTTENRRELTDEERKECALLKSIFESKKKALHLTQQKIADELEVTQATTNQYLNGRRSLNLRVAKTFARALRVDIGDFSPRLKKEAVDIASVAQGGQKNNVLPFISVDEPKNVVLYSFAHLLGTLPVQAQELMEYSGKTKTTTKFLRMENDSMHGTSGIPAPRNSILKIDTSLRPSTHEIAVYVANGSVAIGEHVVINGRTHVRPTNTQYPMLDVHAGELVGVVEEIIIKAR